MAPDINVTIEPTYHRFWSKPCAQCFLTEAQLVAELGDVGFTPEPRVPIREYNRPQPGALSTGTLPVIYEAAFRRT